MKKIAIVLLAITVAMPLSGNGSSAKLSKPAETLVNYLVKDWGNRFHSTTIPHAMENLGMKVNNGLRLEIVEHLRDNTKLARNLRSWGANNYLLTNTEKRIAKLMLNADRNGKKLPSLTDAAKIIGLSKKELSASLTFLAEAGFSAVDKKSPLGYQLADGAQMWGGALRHNFHTIMVEGEDKYDVW